MKKRIILILTTAVLSLGLFASTAMAANPTITTPDPEGGINSALPLVDVDAVDQKDNGVLNANATGSGVAGQTNSVDTVIKSKGMIDNHGNAAATQRTHGEYQNNSNSCASCHQTHTAAAKNLLFKDGVYTTCTACHDGTLGFYNVFEPSTAGTFGGDLVNGNASMHLADGTVAIKAAPGGNKDATEGSWVGEFNCASCHSAHGSYSDRLLNYNPNDMAAVPPSEGGIKADDVPVFDLPVVKADIPANSKYIAYRGSKTQHGLAAGYESVPDSATVIMIYEVTYKDGAVDKVTKTTNPWLYGYPQRGSGDNRHFYYSRLFTEAPTFINTTGEIGTYNKANDDKVIDYYDQDKKNASGNVILSMDFGKGLIWAIDDEGVNALDGIKFAEIARAYVVKFDMVPAGEYSGLPLKTVNEAAFYSGGKGVAMSAYCAACHTDYMAKAGAPSGTFETTSYRHNTTSDSYTCIRCHFAHGTEVDIMKDAENRTIADLVADDWDSTVAKEYMLDKNPSSALKRYTNMSVCWGCHTSSHAEQLKNNDYYMSGNNEVPHGLIDNSVPSVTANDTTNVITGLTAQMEYSISVDNGATYGPWVNGATTPDLTGAKVVKVRNAVAADEVNVYPAKTLVFKTN